MIDLYGAQVDMRLSQGGKWVSIEEILGGGSNYISEIKIDLKIFSIFNLEVSIDAPLDDAVRIINTGRIGLGFTLNNRDATKSTNGKSGSSIVLNKIAIRFTYGGISSRVYRGLLLSPEVSGSSDGIRITLRAVGMLFESTQTENPKEALQGKASDVVKELLSDKKMVNVIFEGTAKEKLDAISLKNVMPVGTNYEQAERIVKASGCYIFYAGANDFGLLPEVRIIPISTARKRIFSFDRKTQTTFVAFKQVDPNRGLFPILSFDTSLASIVSPFGAKGSVVVTFNPDEKKVNVQDVDSEFSSDASKGDRSPESISADGTISGNAEKDAESGEVQSAIERVDENRSILGLIFDGFGLGNSLVAQTVMDYFEKAAKFELTTLGPANLAPGQLIRVNIGDIKFLNSTYDVTSVSHVLSRSGYETQIECLRLFGLVSKANSEIEQKKVNVRDTLSGNKISKPLRN